MEIWIYAKGRCFIAMCLVEANLFVKPYFKPWGLNHNMYLLGTCYFKYRLERGGGHTHSRHNLFPIFARLMICLYKYLI